MSCSARILTPFRFSAAFILAVLIFTFAGVPVIHAQTFSVFHAFSGTDGSLPNGDMIRDRAGNFYGTTQSGGTSIFYGVIFKLDPSGNETVLYNFTGGADGGIPTGRLFRDKNGSLYGMTGAGGDPNCGCGTVYKLTNDGTLTVLHTFLGGTDGAQNQAPELGLFPIGNDLYGATGFGGTPGCDGNLGCGVIFKVSQTGDETVLYSFTGGADAAFPQDLIPDAAGNLYGATAGSYITATANGGVFKIDTSGQFTVLYNFPGGADGVSPHWRLTAGTNGIFYGTTTSGGSSSCLIGPCGVVYSLDTTTSTETVLHTFGATSGDGEEPSGALLKAGGSLYGATFYGGIVNSVCAFGCGVVYGVRTAGSYSVLYRFTGGSDGWLPSGGLTQDSNGNLYGTALLGGNNDNGVVFKITP